MACFTLQITGDNVDFDWVDLPVSLDIDAESQPVIEDDDVDLFTGSYTDDLVYNVTFPNTFKNYKVLGGVMSGANYKMDRREINIVAIYNGEVMYVDRMYAIRNGFNDDGRFEVQLYKSKSWVKLASDKKINTIDFAIPIQQNSANIETFNSFGAKWLDGEIPVRFPLILREDKEVAGSLLSIANQAQKRFVVESDLTPYVSPLAVIRKGFRDLGWNFRCPFLESDAGRRIWVDLTADTLPFNNSVRKPFIISDGFAYYAAPGAATADRTIFIYPMFGNKKNFEIDGNNEVVRLENTNRHEESITPNPNNPWYTQNKYTEAVVIDLTLSMKIKRISPRAGWIFQGSVFIYIKLGATTINAYEYYVSGGDTTDVEISLPEMSINRRDFLNIEIGLYPDLNKPGFLQFTDIELKETKLHTRYLHEAHLYKVNELFQPTDTLLDLVKGIAQPIFGKIHKDEENRTVWLYSPLDFELFDEQIEGYYKEETATLTNIARLEVNSIDDERKRYMQLAFAESYDKVIKEAYPDDDKYLENFSLHGTFVDFGDKYEKSVQTFKNQYFVPTYTPENTFYMCPIAGFEENTYKNKGRRIVFAIGTVSIARTSVIEGGEYIQYARNLKAKFWDRENEFTDPFWAFQSINESLYTLPGGTKFFHLAFSTKKLYTNSTDQFENLYDLICKDYMINLIASQGGTVWKYMKATEFSNFDKRKQYVFTVKDQVIICHVTKIDGYRPCEEGVVGLNFLISDKFRISPTATATPPTNDRPYDPFLDFRIDVERLDCTYFITINY